MFFFVVAGGVVLVGESVGGVLEVFVVVWECS